MEVPIFKNDAKDTPVVTTVHFHTATYWRDSKALTPPEAVPMS